MKTKSENEQAKENVEQQTPTLVRQYKSTLHRLRKTRGITLEQLSLVTNIPVTRIHQLEGADGLRVDLKYAYRLARAFGVQVQDIWPDREPVQMID